MFLIDNCIKSKKTSNGSVKAGVISLIMLIPKNVRNNAVKKEICQQIILSGVTIGDGAIIGTKDVPPYTIIGGVLVKPIRKRFSDNVISELLKLQWWE